MSPRERRLARGVTILLANSVGLTAADLAAKLNATEHELRRPLGMLIGRGIVERCGDYLVVAAKPDEGGAA